MKTILIVIFASLVVLQLTEARPKKKEHHKHKEEMDIDPEEMMKHMTPECLEFFSQPKNLQKMQTMANTNPEGVMKMMMDNKCESLIDWLSKKTLG